MVRVRRAAVEIIDELDDRHIRGRLSLQSTASAVGATVDARYRRLRAGAGRLLSSARSALWTRVSYRDLVGPHGNRLCLSQTTWPHMAVTSNTFLSRGKRWCLVRSLRA